AVLVDVVDAAAADLVGKLDGCERFLVRAGILAGRPDSDAGRGHERRRALRRRNRRIGTELEQRAHERDVAGLCGEQERRRTDALELVAVAVRGLLLL